MKKIIDLSLQTLQRRNTMKRFTFFFLLLEGFHYYSLTIDGVALRLFRDRDK